MSTIELHIQDFRANSLHDCFQSNWDLKRNLRHTYETYLTGEEAAEEAFHVTNAPPSLLSDEELQKAETYRGPSLSVGDVVRIVTNGQATDFLCCSCGWEEKDKREVLVSIR